MEREKSPTGTLERMVEVAKRAMQPNPYCQGKPYLQHWIDQYDGKTKPSLFYRIFPSWEPEERKQKREGLRLTAKLCRDAYRLVDKVANAGEGDNLERLRSELLDLEERFDGTRNTKIFCRTPDVVRELLFQYEDIVRQRLGYILENKPEDVRFITLGVFDHLCDYAQQYPELSKEVIRKIGDVYGADIKRQKETGKRRLAFFSPGAGVPVSTASNCIIALERLGRSLGLNKSEAYTLAGLNEETVKRYDKEWSEKAAKHIREGGLGSEFVD